MLIKNVKFKLLKEIEEVALFIKIRVVTLKSVILAIREEVTSCVRTHRLIRISEW